MAKLQAGVRIDPKVTRLVNSVSRKLAVEVLPRALAKAAVVVETAIEAKLAPHDSRKTGTKQLQTEFVQNKFPTHTVERVRTKTITDEAGVLKVVGVDNKAGQVRFDYGDKAKGEGRNHILWGHRPNPPRLRRQTQDIPKEVAVEVGQQVSQIVVNDLRHAIDSGELLR